MSGIDLCSSQIVEWNQWMAISSCAIKTTNFLKAEALTLEPFQGEDS